MTKSTLRFQRRLESQLRAALAEAPAVLLQGPSQSGKAMLAASAAPGRNTISLDDADILQAAKADPAGLVRGLDQVTLLECQRAPQLVAAVQNAVAAGASQPGRFLLTASGDMSPLLSNTTAPGNPIRVVTLLGLSQSEQFGAQANWLDCAFAGQLPQLQAPRGTDIYGTALQEATLMGGFGESIARTVDRSRHLWLRSYLLDLLDPKAEGNHAPKDLNALAKLLPPGTLAALDKPTRLLPMLEAVALEAGHLANYRQLGISLGLNSKTAERYVLALAQLFLVEHLPAFGTEGTGSTRKVPRAVKAPKLHFLDSGLLADLLVQNGVVAERHRARLGSAWSPMMAQVLESFVYTELKKHAANAQGRYQFSHYRDHDQLEVDLVVENGQGDVIAIDIKAGATVAADDFKTLEILADKVGPSFKLGILLYDGNQSRQVVARPTGQGLWQIPVSSLWGELAQL